MESMSQAPAKCLSSRLFGRRPGPLRGPARSSLLHPKASFQNSANIYNLQSKQARDGNYLRDTGLDRDQRAPVVARPWEFCCFLHCSYCPCFIDLHWPRQERAEASCSAVGAFSGSSAKTSCATKSLHNRPEATQVASTEPLAGKRVTGRFASSAFGRGTGLRASVITHTPQHPPIYAKPCSPRHFGPLLTHVTWHIDNMPAEQNTQHCRRPEARG